MTEDQAAVVALGALAWLAQNDLLDTFQSTTGADRETIRAAADDPAFLGAILDFALMNDDWVRGICDAQALPYERLLAARTALPGGDAPHWT